MVVGGQVSLIEGGTTTADINNSNNSWKKTGSLLSARSLLALAAVYNNAIIIIGGCTKGDTMANAKSFSVTIMELGQAELLH